MEGRSWSQTFLFLYLGIIFFLIGIQFFPHFPIKGLYPAIGFSTLILLFFLCIRLKSLFRRSHILLLSALSFSTIGYIALQAQGKGFFLAGMFSLLFSYLCYIQLFLAPHNYSEDQSLLTRKPRVMFPILIFMGVLFLIVAPQLGVWLIPAGIYSFVLIGTVLMALNRWGLVSKNSFRAVILGSVSLLMAESLLALNEFYLHIHEIEAFLIFLYGMGHFGIVKGILAEWSKVPAMNRLVQSRVNSSIKS